jgi:hypothetical protein
MADVPTRGASQPRFPPQATRRGPFGRRGRSVHRLGDHGRYWLDEPLFQDPLGTVWSATDQGTAARLSLRVFEGPVVDHPGATARLRSRLEGSPQIVHPNVALVFYHEVPEKGAAFMTMERLRGETLAQRLERDGTVPPTEAAELGAALAQGLAAAHERGVIHGGITADLVFLTSSGPKLLGLGLGDLLRGEDDGDRPSAEEDVLGLMKLVQTISSGPFADLIDGSGIEADQLPGGPVGARALSEDPSLRPTAQELAAALAGQPSTVPPPPIPAAFPSKERSDEGERLPVPPNRSVGEAVEREQAEREQAERERAEQDRAERERAERERAEREQAEREQAEREQAEREQAEREQAEREQAEREQAEREQAEREQAEREKAEREKAEREKAERERSRPLREDTWTASQKETEVATVGKRRGVIAVALGIAVAAAIGVAAWVASPNEAIPPPTTASQAAAPSSPDFVPATVPDVLRRSLQVAKDQLVAANLQVGRVVNVAGTLGHVVRTDPTPGEAVTAGTPVTIYVGDGS